MFDSDIEKFKCELERKGVTFFTPDFYSLADLNKIDPMGVLRLIDVVALKVNLNTTMGSTKNSKYKTITKELLKEVDEPGSVLTSSIPHIKIDDIDNSNAAFSLNQLFLRSALEDMELIVFNTNTTSEVALPMMLNTKTYKEKLVSFNLDGTLVQLNVPAKVSKISRDKSLTPLVELLRVKGGLSSAAVRAIGVHAGVILDRVKKQNFMMSLNVKLSEVVKNNPERVKLSR